MPSINSRPLRVRHEEQALSSSLKGCSRCLILLPALSRDLLCLDRQRHVGKALNHFHGDRAQNLNGVVFLSQVSDYADASPLAESSLFGAVERGLSVGAPFGVLFSGHLAGDFVGPDEALAGFLADLDSISVTAGRSNGEHELFVPGHESSGSLGGLLGGVFSRVVGVGETIFGIVLWLVLVICCLSGFATESLPPDDILQASHPGGVVADLEEDILDCDELLAASGGELFGLGQLLIH